MKQAPNNGDPATSNITLTSTGPDNVPVLVPVPVPVTALMIITDLPEETALGITGNLLLYQNLKQVPNINSKLLNFSQDEYGPPSHWPISYLYNDPPPNETYPWVPERHYHHHGQEDDSPKIRFKNPNNKAAYPKATVHKLDVKDNPPAKDPGEVMPPSGEDEQNDKNQPINPRVNYSKKLEMIDKVPDSDLKYVINLNPSNCGKDHVHNHNNEVPQFSSTTSKPQIEISNFLSSNSSAVLYTSAKRQLSEQLKALMENELEMNKNISDVEVGIINNDTDVNSNKTKEIIHKVEKIIEENSKENNVSTTETAEIEMLDKESSEHVGYVAHYIDYREAKPRKEDDSAMTRFWNWSQEKYSNGRS